MTISRRDPCEMAEVIPPPCITVIIPTNGGAQVGRCLDALRQAAGALPIQVICVVVGRLSGPLPVCDTIVTCEASTTWAGAVDAGLRSAQHPVVLLTNERCEFVRSGDLERLVNRLDCCGTLIALASSDVNSRSINSENLHGTGVAHCKTYIEWLLVRREAFAATGGIHPHFRTQSGALVEWLYRARQSGYEWSVDGETQIRIADCDLSEPVHADELGADSSYFREIHGQSPLGASHWVPRRCGISWIIAARGAAGHLGRCLGSIAAVRSMIPTDMEVLLTVDGRCDLTARVARSVNQALPEPLPLRIVEFPEPAGSAAKAKNRAFRLAIGDVFLPMDADDATTAGRVRLIRALEGGAEIVTGDFWVVGLDGSITLTHAAPPIFDELINPKAQNWGLWATAAWRDTWAKYGLHAEDRLANEDLELWLRWLRDGAIFQHIDVPVHIYMLRPGSTIFSHPTAALGDEIRAAYSAGHGRPRMGLQTRFGNK